jgi:hypothetical protein
MSENKDIINIPVSNITQEQVDELNLIVKNHFIKFYLIINTD